METPLKHPSTTAAATTTTTAITQLDDDLLQNILSKLPAKSFGYAACVSRSWNGICSRVLSRPKLCSSISINPSLPEAIKEVVGKVLCGPIRPHFAILCVCPAFGLEGVHQFVTKELSSSIPIVTCCTYGIIGREAKSDQLLEVSFPYFDEVDFDEPFLCQGVSLTVGYVPGLKVAAIPLLPGKEGPMIDKFVMDIRNFSISVSNCRSPEVVIMFGDSETDMKPVLEKLDYALSKETIVAGNETCSFRCGGIDKSESTCTCPEKVESSDRAIALVFATDKNNLDGKTKFHFSVGTGVSAVGPMYKVASAKMRVKVCSTWLTAKRQGENETLDGQQMLEDVNLEIPDSDLYIGVTKKRKCFIGSEKVKSVTSLVHHPVQNADEEYLYVAGGDIKTGDLFRFYVPDRTLALSSCHTVSENFRDLKHLDIIGGFIFACCGRGSTFLGKPNVDSLPLLDNFPCSPLAGMFCGGEIGRGPSQKGQEECSEHRLVHVYSSVYLLLSYGP